MKKILMVLTVLLGALASCLPAHAASFADLVDFTGQTHPTLHYTYNDVADNAKFSWTHSILDDLGSYGLSEIKLLDTELSLTYAKTEGNENWTLTGFGALLKTVDQPLTTAFILSTLQLGQLQQTGQITILPAESTTGVDPLRLIESRLSGHFEIPKKAEPVNAPEPSTILSILLGLGGLSAVKIKPRSRG